MALYKEQTTTSTSYQRAKQISIFNYYNQAPKIQIVEEIIKDGEPAGTPAVKGITKTFTPAIADTPFNVINPETGETIAVMTYGELYAAIYSLYFHLAGERDSS